MCFFATYSSCIYLVFVVIVCVVVFFKVKWQLSCEGHLNCYHLWKNFHLWRTSCETFNSGSIVEVPLKGVLKFLPLYMLKIPCPVDITARTSKMIMVQYSVEQSVIMAKTFIWLNVGFL